MLFQVHFLSLLLEERGAGDMAAVADNCREKLIRRHPHVFGGGEARSAGEVLRNWDRIKVEEEGQAEPFADVPENLPALLYARKLQRRSASRAGGLGLSAEHLEALGRAREAIASLEAATAGEGDASPEAPREKRAEIERRLGEALFALVDGARLLKADPELALRAASRRFRDDAS